MSYKDLINDIQGILSKDKIIILSCLVLLFLLPLTVFVSTQSQKQETRTRAEEITTSLDSLNTQILANNTSGNFAINKILLEQRKEQMLDLAQEI